MSSDYRAAARPHAEPPHVGKAVLTVAGLGTRFLPATKATPKELLPVVDKPAIQYVVEEAVAAGLTDILFVTGRAKGALEDHFDRAPELEAALEAKGDKERLRAIREPVELATIHYVRQAEPRGLGHAVLCAKQHVGHEPFAVLLGDDIVDQRDPLLDRMIEVRGQYGGSVIALIEVDPASIHLYGCAAVRAVPGERDVVRIDDLIEKPEHDAPSNLAIIGRYVLDPAIFEVLAQTPPGRGNEIQLTDALRALAGRDGRRGGPVHGVLFRGRRYDTGDKAEYLRATVRLACNRDDLGPEFRQWLKTFVAEEMDRQ
jgi:UTP--glucose-1-phosphate uridylyltransferase